MKKILTICFYEYPAALHEIEAWEKLKKESIIDKTSNDGIIRFILMTSKNEVEMLICFPNYTKCVEDSKKFISEKIKNGFIYNKTLLFGKFSSTQLIKITNVIKFYE